MMELPSTKAQRITARLLAGKRFMSVKIYVSFRRKMAYRQIAEAFPPGEFIREELEARGWNQQDLADILGRTPTVVSQILTGKREITPELAKLLGDAFDVDAQFFMNLESSYRLFIAGQSDSGVGRRA